MKLRFMSAAAITGLLLLFTGAGFCQDKISASEWTEKIGQGAVNWSAGYIEALGIGAPADKTIGKANARPMALRAAKIDAYRNLLEITKGVRVDSTTTIKDFTVESDVINTQVDGLVKGAVIVDQQYMSDGTVEVRLRMPLYGNLSQVIIPASIEKRKSVPLPETPAAPAVAAPSTPPMTYTGLVVDARGIQARPAMSPRIFDEDGKEVYGSANVDREYAVQQGMSGYARDLTAAQSNQRVTNSPVTVKALKTSGAGKADLIISNADAQQIKASAENASFMKKCRVMIVLD
ncbi:MAG: LPP20 family lipoprotein [Smithellaceae bacterium]